MRILIVIALLLLLAAPAYAQSSQTLGMDLEWAKRNVYTCLSNAGFYNPNSSRFEDRKGPGSLARATDLCIEDQLAGYRRSVEIEEKLIEGMSRSCCPNIKQQPGRQPYYQGPPKEYKNVEGVRPQGGERDELERMMARLKEGMK